MACSSLSTKDLPSVSFSPHTRILFFLSPGIPPHHKNSIYKRAKKSPYFRGFLCVIFPRHFHSLSCQAAVSAKFLLKRCSLFLSPDPFLPNTFTHHSFFSARRIFSSSHQNDISFFYLLVVVGLFSRPSLTSPPIKKFLFSFRNIFLHQRLSLPQASNGEWDHSPTFCSKKGQVWFLFFFCSSQ